jgi:hypothetical protein
MPPPPVSGAAVGNAGVAGADVCAGACVAAVWVGPAVAKPVAWGEPEDEAEARDELDA